MRMQLHQLMDACLFAVSFWLAYEVRAHAAIVTAGLGPAAKFEEFVWFRIPRLTNKLSDWKSMFSLKAGPLRDRIM